MKRILNFVLALVLAIVLIAITAASGLWVYWYLVPRLSKDWQAAVAAIAGAVVVAVTLIRGLFGIMGFLKGLFSKEQSGLWPEASNPDIPLQRPTRAKHFTGREDDLTRLLESLYPGQVVTLCGPGGIGKTALAAKAVWTLAPSDEPPERFPDGIVFYSFYGRPSVALAFEHIVRSFDETARDTSAAAAQRVLSRKRALLILDGAEQADDLPAVLRVRGGCGVLVTTRRRGDALTHRQDVAPLPNVKAVELLQAWGGEQVGDKTVAGLICEQVGRLPLAVRLVGRYLVQTGESAEEYQDWLAESPIAALSHGQHREESVELLLARSLEQVSEGAGQALAVVGLLVLAPFTVEPIVGALGRARHEVRRWLGELVSYGLLLCSDDRYEVSHALVHTYARRRQRAPDKVVVQLADYYTRLAETESEKGLAGYRRLDDERGHLMQVLDDCKERREWEAVRSLVWAVDGYLDIQGHWVEWVTALETGVRAAQRLELRRDEGAFQGNLGVAYSAQGEVRRAIEYYEQALAIAQEIGDRRAEGNSLGNLGNAYRDLGEARRAIEYYKQALAIAQEIGNRRAEGNSLGNLGVAYSALGEVRRAIEYYKQALAIAQEIGDRRGEGASLGNLGGAYHELGEMRADGEHPGAIECYEQALVITREIGDRRGEGDRLGNLGGAYHELGEVRRAIEYYEQALAIAQKIGDQYGEGGHLSNLGGAYRDLGEVRRAIEYYEQALAIAQEIGDRRGEGIRLGSLGGAYRELGEVRADGEHPGAIEYYEQALAIAQDIGHQRSEGAWLGGLGVAYSDLGEVGRAIEYFEQALAIAQEIGDRRGEAFYSWNLGLLYEESDPARAVELMSVCVAYKQEIGHPDAEEDAQYVAEIRTRSHSG